MRAPSEHAKRWKILAADRWLAMVGATVLCTIASCFAKPACVTVQYSDTGAPM